VHCTVLNCIVQWRAVQCWCWYWRSVGIVAYRMNECYSIAQYERNGMVWYGMVFHSTTGVAIDIAQYSTVQYSMPNRMRCSKLLFIAPSGFSFDRRFCAMNNPIANHSVQQWRLLIVVLLLMLLPITLYICMVLVCCWEQTIRIPVVRVVINNSRKLDSLTFQGRIKY
jgi:hypothetical protein